MNSMSDLSKLKNDLVSQLINAGEHLTETLAASIIERGREVIPELIAILEDEELAKWDAPGDGYAPVHAVGLLGDLEAIEAASSMLQVLCRCDSMDILYSKLIFALESFGRSILEPTLKAYDAASDDKQRNAVLCVLAGLKVQDDRILPLLLRQLKNWPERGASLLAEYGDPAALPYLSAALDACKLDKQGKIFANHEVIEITAAIEELDGTLTAPQRSLLEDVDDSRNELSKLLFNSIAMRNERLLRDAVQSQVAVSKIPLPAKASSLPLHRHR